MQILLDLKKKLADLQKKIKESELQSATPKGTVVHADIPTLEAAIAKQVRKTKIQSSVHNFF